MGDNSIEFINQKKVWPLIFMLKEKRINLLGTILHHSIPNSNDSGMEGFWKTLLEKEKMLVTCIFSFTHNVFYSVKKEFLFFSHVQVVVCKCFRFGLGLNFVIWQRVNPLQFNPKFYNNLRKGVF